MDSSVHRLLSFLWAPALVFSFSSSSLWVRNITQMWPSHLALGSAILLLCYPTSLRLLQLSAVLFIASAATTLPALPNHRLVLLFVAFTIVAGTYRAHSIENASPKLGGTIRWLTLVVYFFAGLAKLNWSYLEPTVSCATLFLKQAFQLHGMTPPSDKLFGVSQSVAGLWSSITELVLLIFLVPRRTRHLAVFAGIAFHIFLATHYVKYFINFSTVMFILLASWLSEQSCRALLERFIEPHQKGFIVGALIMTGLVVASALDVLPYQGFVYGRYALFALYALPLLMMMIKTAHQPGDTDSGGRPFLTLIVLALFNGLCPYLGIKTRTGFSMYSNLRIEPTYSNHLFIPKSPDILGYMSDVVTITATTDPILAGRMAGGPLQLPYISLCSSLAGMDESLPEDATFTYERNGALYIAARGEALPADCPSWLERKLFFFGPVGDGAERLCVW